MRLKHAEIRGPVYENSSEKRTVPTTQCIKSIPNQKKNLYSLLLDESDTWALDIESLI